MMRGASRSLGLVVRVCAPLACAVGIALAAPLFGEAGLDAATVSAARGVPFAVPDRVATGTATPLITLPTDTAVPPTHAPPTATALPSTTVPPPNATAPPPSRVTDGLPPTTVPTGPPPTSRPTDRPAPSTAPPDPPPTVAAPTAPPETEPPSAPPSPDASTSPPGTAPTLERSVIHDGEAAPIVTGSPDAVGGSLTVTGEAAVTTTAEAGRPKATADGSAPAATLAPTPFRQLGPLRVPLDDPGQRRAWAERGPPWAGVPLVERFTAGRPGPLGWRGTYLLVAAVYVALVVGLVRQLAGVSLPSEEEDSDAPAVFEDGHAPPSA